MWMLEGLRSCKNLFCFGLDSQQKRLSRAWHKMNLSMNDTTCRWDARNLLWLTLVDHPSVRPSDRPTVRPTVRPSARPSVRPTVRPSIWKIIKGIKNIAKIMKKHWKYEEQHENRHHENYLGAMRLVSGSKS